MAKSVSGSSRYKPQVEELIHQILGFNNDDEIFRKHRSYALSCLHNHLCLDVNSHSVQRSLQGIALKMDIHGHQNKSKKLLSLTEKFMASECQQVHGWQEADVKWSILSLLVDLAEHPARDALSTSLCEGTSVDSTIDQQSLEIDWIRELMEKSFQIPDKDETLSEWSDDEEVKLSIHGNEFDDLRKYSLSSNKCEDAEYWEKVNLSTKNAHLAKSWIENAIQPNYWGSNDRAIKDYCFASNSGGQNNSKMLIVSEYIAIRECLWILICPTNGFLFYTDQKGKHQVKTVSLSTVSSGSMLNLLRKFASAADQLSILDLWLENNHGLKFSFGSGTFQAYSDALRNWRQSFNKQIVELESIVIAQEGCETLIWLFDRLEPFLHDLSFIFKIHSETILQFSEKDEAKMSLQFIKALIKNIDSHASIQSRECLLTILRFTLKYYFQLLQFLLWNRNVMPTSLKLFGITCMENEQHLNENCVAKLFSCDNSMIDILRELSFTLPIRQSLIKICELKEIMGKLQVTVEKDWINIEKHVDTKIIEAFSPQVKKKNSSPEFESKPNSQILKQPIDISYPDEYLKLAFEFDEDDNYLEKCEEREFIPTEINRFASIEDVLTKSLVPIVDERYQELSNGLMKLLKEKHNLQMQLSAFKAVTLMEVGDSLHEFYSYLFYKVDGKEIVDGALLTQHIQNCIGYSYPLFAENFSICFTGVDGIKDNEMSDKYFNSILSSMSIHYESVWPISLVLSEDIIKKYSNLFIFCLLLKRSIFTLERLHFKEIASYAAYYSNQQSPEDVSLNDKSKNFTCTSDVSEDELPLIQRLHRLQLLRHWLIYLARVLHDHFYISILMPFSHKVDKLIEEEPHYENFVRSHVRIINEACHQCLLKDGSLSPVQTALGKVFSTIETVRVLWRGHPDNITNQFLIQLEDEYGTCHRFMANFFTTLSHTHACPHVEALAESLMNSCPA